MRLYGYEGYPVVDQGKVVGLLTRRAVDRTISHRLNYILSRALWKPAAIPSLPMIRSSTSSAW